MKIKLPRNYASALSISFFPLFEKIKVANFNNVRNMTHMSGDYQTVRLINSLLDEVQYAIDRKLLVTKGSSITVEFNDAEGIAFMRMLMQVPIDKEQVFCLLVRSKVIEQLDIQLTNSIASDCRYR